jgi:hypothetical protein
MSTEFNELLSIQHGDKAQIWIIGTRDQVLHLINECYVKRLTNDRSKFSPIFPAPFVKGLYMAVLER